LPKLVDFNEAHLHEVTLNDHTHAWIFSCLSIVSADGKQHLSEAVFSTLVGFSLWGRSWSLVFLQRSLNQVRGMCWSIVVPSFSLQWKSDESTKHYITQMLHTINWRYWQVGKNSRMCMMVEGHLMLERFIEIHQVFEKKERLDSFLTE
jgi:hypothetical protein